MAPVPDVQGLSLVRQQGSPHLAAGREETRCTSARRWTCRTCGVLMEYQLAFVDSGGDACSCLGVGQTFGDLASLAVTEQGRRVQLQASCPRILDRDRVVQVERRWTPMMTTPW